MMVLFTGVSEVVGEWSGCGNFCGRVSCGLWVPLMSSVCGQVLLLVYE